MSVNAKKEEYEHVELFGKPALFTTSRIDRNTVPEGFHCYDLRGSDYDPDKPVTLENQVVVNHAGTVLTAEPVTIPKDGFRRLHGKLNFLGECLTLPNFCERHGILLPSDDRKFILRPASPHEAGLFYALTKEQDAALGAVGHVRIDFGRGGNEFWYTWHPHGGDSLNCPEFKAELAELVNELREYGPLKNLSAMTGYCGNRGGKIEGGWRQNYGYVIETERYRYCLRCNPGPGDYHAYLTAFDLRVQQMNRKQEASEQEHGLTEAGKEALRNAADNTCSHSYSWFVFQDYNTPDEKLIGDLTLPDAIRLYNETDSESKRLGVTKAEISTVDLLITLNGNERLSEDYTRLASFSGDPVITKAMETLREAFMEQALGQGITMGGL